MAPPADCRPGGGSPRAAGPGGRHLPPRGGGSRCGAGDTLRASHAARFRGGRHSRGATLGECAATGGRAEPSPGCGGRRTGHRDGGLSRCSAQGASAPAPRSGRGAAWPNGAEVARRTRSRSGVKRTCWRRAIEPIPRGAWLPSRLPQTRWFSTPPGSGSRSRWDRSWRWRGSACPARFRRPRAMARASATPNPQPNRY